AAVLGLLAGLGILLFGSVSASLANLRGTLIVAPNYADFGTGDAGQTLRHTITIHNYSREPVRIVGGTADCSCLTTGSLPVTIAPGGHAELELVLKLPTGTVGAFTRTAKLWTDHKIQRELILTLGSQVAEPLPASPR
ncbi:MAG: DUF1573 domain-containing protein, partial [Gemmataceae bacterium]